MMGGAFHFFFRQASQLYNRPILISNVQDARADGHVIGRRK